LVDGGLAGLNLLTLLDGCDRVIFVDTILGGGLEDVQVLPAGEVEPSVYGHAGGLGFLLGAYRVLGADSAASICVVGAGTVESAQRVAEAALVMAQGQEVRQ
jgi:Ni,Fe-hydrogenase maturation factor